MSKTKTVSAWMTSGSVRIALPIEQIEEGPAGHRELEAGVFRIGLHIGNKWMVVHNYSIWSNRHNKNGECFGDVYWAYDRTNPHEAKLFVEHYWKTHQPTDLITGRSALLEYLFPKKN